MNDENERSVASTGSVDGGETVPDANSRVWETYPPVCHVSLQKNLTLTDAEREAVAWYAAYGAGDHAATLRGLLERMG